MIYRNIPWILLFRFNIFQTSRVLTFLDTYNFFEHYSFKDLALNVDILKQKKLINPSLHSEGVPTFWLVKIKYQVFETYPKKILKTIEPWANIGFPVFELVYVRDAVGAVDREDVPDSVR